MIYYVYQDQQNRWRWTLYAGNNEAIAVSSESYWNRADCEHAIGLVKASYNAPIRYR